MTELKRLSSEESPPEVASSVPVPQTVEEESKPNMWVKILLIAGVLLLGVGSGFAVQAFAPKSSTSRAEGSMRDKKIDGTAMKVGDIFGVKDTTSEFTDTAEGVLEKGGSKGGEGSHKLVRPGGESQTAYLTSSVVDLDEFVGHKIKIWGKTFAAQKAGWLLDVGRVQILELNAQSPAESE